MQYYKTVVDGYVLSICASTRGTGNTDETEYLAIKEALETAPAPEAGFAHKLRYPDLVWETIKYVPPEYPEIPTDNDKAEAYDILMGVST